MKAGQVIARLEPETFEAQVAQAQANLSVAKANLAQAMAEAREARRQFERLLGLRERELVSTSEVDQAATKAATTCSVIAARRAQVEQAQAALAQAEFALGQTVLHSPVDRVVLQRAVDVGQGETAGRDPELRRCSEASWPPPTRFAGLRVRLRPDGHDLPLPAPSAVGVAGGVGIVFGLYPAVKAARLDPSDRGTARRDTKTLTR